MTTFKDSLITGIKAIGAIIIAEFVFVILFILAGALGIISNTPLISRILLIAIIVLSIPILGYVFRTLWGWK